MRQKIIISISLLVAVSALFMYARTQTNKPRIGAGNRSYSDAALGVSFQYPESYGTVVADELTVADERDLVSSGEALRLSFEKNPNVTMIFATGDFQMFKSDAFLGDVGFARTCVKESVLDTWGSGCMRKTVNGSAILIRSEYIADEGVYNLFRSISYNLANGKFRGLKIIQYFPSVYEALNQELSESDRALLVQGHARSMLFEDGSSEIFHERMLVDSIAESLQLK